MSAPKLLIKEDGLYVENPESEAEFIAELRNILNEIGVASFNETDYVKNSKTAEDNPVLLSKSLPTRLDAKIFFFLAIEDPTKVIATIIPPRSGKRLSKADVLLKLDELGYDGVSPDLSSIDKALDRQKTEELTYSFTVGSRILPEIEVEVESDNMEASIIIKPEKEKNHLFEEDIYFALKNSGVVRGHQKDIILDIIKKQECYELRVVARGASPVSGDDGEILYHFDAVNEIHGPQMDEKGKADHHNLGVYKDVEEGAILCEVSPPSKGLPGYDVLGGELPAEPGKVIDLPVGQNTKPKPNKSNVLIAAISGIPKLSSGKVIIDPVLNIQGDVGTSTGDVEFKGPINISGTIQDGFKVVAKGDVIINESCNSATIESEGDVILKYGIRSDEGAFIKAGGDVHAAFLEGVTVEAGGNVIIQDYIYHSHITAGKAVEVIGKKGYISGGKIVAHQPVLAKRLGSPAVPRTEIELISSKHSNAKLAEPDQIKLDKFIEDLNETISTIERVEEKLEGREDTKGDEEVVETNEEENEEKSSDEKSENDPGLKTKEESSSGILEKLNKDKKEILRNIRIIDPDYIEPGLVSSLFVAILGTVHSNVLVSIDGIKLKVNNEFIDVKFVRRQDKIAMEGIDSQDFENFIANK